MPRTDSQLRERARRLGREPTKAEQRLWSILRDRQLGGVHFRRQHPIPPYVADFACVGVKLVVEVDGGQHSDSDNDAQRDAYLQRHGWRVLRFWSNDVLKDTEGVAHQIAEALKVPPPRPSPAARERESGTKRAALPPPSPEAGRGGGILARATAVAPDGEPFATVTLAYDDRHRRRLRLVTDAGHPFLLDLAETRVLRDGDRLALDDGNLILVCAAPEAVLDIHAPDAPALARIAWHLGNRHTPTQILPGALRIRADHVLEHLLTDHLGAVVRHATAPFDPEGGAYGHRHEH